MIVTVLAIFDEFDNKAPLAKVLRERLLRMATELQEIHLKPIMQMPPMDGDVVIYISYNLKYAVRWSIVNDVPDFIEKEIAQICALKGYIPWKNASLNIFKQINK
ncbi:MAG: hypothetical protein EOO87_17900 [Pedobacter sp.]|uniref:hypothetical protein n=1 Tax=Pedobacter namyangjuensis TaxID=600626 RepID=UPI000DE2ABDE|nr:hypothetical protein [Pedobacter namyangjuensis]RZK51333.1 MAG: hypothetical protein EOO87_17900 [Pedobacter sp.]